jgi:hypothetical protein
MALRTEEKHMKTCPACGSKEIYEYRKGIRYSGCGEELLPKLATSFFSVGAQIRPTVCVDCGHVGLFASQDARMKARGSEHWQRLAGE